MTSKGNIYPALTINTTGAITGSADVYLVDASGGAIVITLPAASSLIIGRRITFRRTDSTVANTVTITRAGTDTIGSLTSVYLDVKKIIELQVVSASQWQDLIEQNGRSSFKALGTTTPQTLTGIYDCYTADSTAGNLTITLPSVASMGLGRMLTFRNIGSANNIVLTAAGTDTVNSAATLNVIHGGSTAIVVSSATNWAIVMIGA